MSRPGLAATAGGASLPPAHIRATAVAPIPAVLVEVAQAEP
jgi:hypothetical protein